MTYVLPTLTCTRIEGARMNRRHFACSTAVRVALLVTIALLASGGAARAALLAYEPFRYGAPPEADEYLLGNEETGVGVLGGQDPLPGPTLFYGGPWVQSGGDAQVVKALRSLSHPGLQAPEGGVVQETVQFDCCSFGRSGRPIAGGLGTGPARTFYQSFLIDFGSQGTDDPTAFGLRGHELWNGGVGDTFLGVQLSLNSFSGINELSLRVITEGGETIVPVSGGGLTLDALAGDHLVVMKYAFHPIAADVVSVFLDPVVGDPEPDVADAQITVAESDLLLTHQGAVTNFVFSGGGHVPATIDEIRWGDTFADVTPVPEPAASLLCAAAVAAVARLRRR
jgi:hypothetical protein